MHHMTCSFAHGTRIMVGMTTPKRSAPIVTSARRSIAVSAEALLSQMRQTAADELASIYPRVRGAVTVGKTGRAVAHGKLIWRSHDETWARSSP